MTSGELELTDYRRTVSELYAAVRAEDDPKQAHELWREGRDELFRSHPQSPLPPGDPLRTRADATRIQADLGLVPSTPIERGLAAEALWARGLYS